MADGRPPSVIHAMSAVAKLVIFPREALALDIHQQPNRPLFQSPHVFF
jgi:hypothetical protein